MAPDLLLMTVVVFVAVALVSAMGANWILERNAPERRRLRSIIGLAAPTGVVVPMALTTSLDPMLARLSQLMPRSGKDMTRLQRRLARAGFAQPAAAAYYAAAEVVLPLAAGLLAFVI